MPSRSAIHIDDKGTRKQVFYPFSMLQDTGSLTIETGKRSQRRAAGLLYSQFYSSVKEVFAAGNVYPFTNGAIETLALTPCPIPVFSSQSTQPMYLFW